MKRLILEDGLRLDIRRLLRDGSLIKDQRVVDMPIAWHDSWSGNEISNGLISGDLTTEASANLKVELGAARQEIALVARPGRFGGTTWLMVCPVRGTAHHILWLLPPASDKFVSAGALRDKAGFRSEGLGRLARRQYAANKIAIRASCAQEAHDIIPGWSDLPTRRPHLHRRSYQRLEMRYERERANILRVLDHVLDDLGSDFP